jgi:hypothetical protein
MAHGPIWGPALRGVSFRGVPSCQCVRGTYGNGARTVTEAPVTQVLDLLFAGGVVTGNVSHISGSDFGASGFGCASASVSWELSEFARTRADSSHRVKVQERSGKPPEIKVLFFRS